MSTSNFKNLFAECLTIFVSLIIVICLSEGILRLNNDFGYYVPAEHPKHDEQGERLYWGYPWNKMEYSTILKFNKSGYNYAEFDRAAGKDMRVAVIGDSYVEGFQLPLKDNFVYLSQKYFKHVHTLALGKSSRYLPRQLQFYRDEIEKLFGKKGIYPSIDAVIFCLSNRGMHYISKGTYDFEITMSALPWRYLIKQPLIEKLKPVFNDYILSRLHIKSLLSYKFNLFLKENLEKEIPPLTEEKQVFAQAIFEREVIKPLINISKKRGHAIGFLYLPRIEEVDHDVDADHNLWRRLTLEVLNRNGAPTVDANKYFKTGKDTFFKSDTHANKKGNQLISLALRDLIVKMNLGSIKE